MTSAKFEKWNDKMAFKYNPEKYYSHRNPFVRYLYVKRVRVIMDMLPIEKGDNILDVGCGSGYLLSKIKKGNLTGLDLSENLLSISRKRLKHREIRLIKGDTQNMSMFKENEFNHIICTEVLEHVPNPKKVVAEISRIAKPDAIIILTIPNEKVIDQGKDFLSKTRLFDLFLNEIPVKNEWHLHHFSLSLFKSLIRKKLRIIEIRAIPLSLLSH